jgi:hypothetical protein
MLKDGGMGAVMAELLEGLRGAVKDARGAGLMDLRGKVEAVSKHSLALCSALVANATAQERQVARLEDQVAELRRELRDAREGAE